MPPSSNKHKSQQLGRMKKLLLLLSLFAILSCSKDTPIGLWDDNIKLSQKEVEFDAKENTIVITTEGAWWWIDALKLNGSYINIDDMDTAADNFVIEEPEFKIERKNATEIHISMSENLSDNKRVLIIGLEAGDYFDGIRVTQSAH
ncbi:hypothetical protein LH29_05315 [Draconibacterium sediminis]|uniref:BACON domain-containing protein n=2 Tax=Draconibacterium sediminis TaxID=1544798 RepID=A0A0D8JG66_9BACT|nr:hypothetical protein LH29_05315 [Draconibacterium sediminis]